MTKKVLISLDDIEYISKCLLNRYGSDVSDWLKRWFDDQSPNSFTISFKIHEDDIKKLLGSDLLVLDETRCSECGQYGHIEHRAPFKMESTGKHAKLVEKAMKRTGVRKEYNALIEEEVVQEHVT